jgi:hypothetical protein
VNASTDRSAKQASVILARGIRRSLAAAVLALTLAACGASARPIAVRAASAPPACGTAAPASAAQAAGLVADHIYRLELDSAEVRADRRQVEGYAPLLSALAGGNRVALLEAVHSLVYSHTHLVRLRITRAGNVLADVGGPYIIAPVTGTLRTHGRTLAHYVLSVQDDLGYVKLEQRFIGHQLILRVGSQRVPVEGTLPSAASGLPFSGPVSYRGAGYEIYTLGARAFPSGTLRISLLVPRPASSTLSCSAIRVAELARIGQRIWRRFVAVAAPPSAYVHALGSLTGALAYVRSGARQLAGSTQPGPARLPASGAVSYRGRAYEVSSFPARTTAGPVRVYQLLRP